MPAISSDESPVMLSALQHYLFCPRQCALIHVEGVWSENFLTASGRQLHERVDRRGGEKHVDVLCRVRDSLPDAERLRGLEGEAGAAYFGSFNELLVAQKEDFAISGRTRRPPTDPMNALLSYLYTLLAHYLRGDLDAYPPFILK